MALTLCPECGKEISDNARACPNCPDMDYEGIMRNPEKARGTIAKCFGEVIQVVETTSTYQKLMVMTEDDKGVLVSYYKEPGSDNVLEDDYIVAYGIFYLTESYVSLLGEERNVPVLVADYVDIL